MSATKKQIGLIHVLAGKAGMDDDTRRDYLQRETGARSTKYISGAQAARVIDDLQRKVGVPGAVAGLDNPVGGKLRALWIAGYDLGLVRDRTDRAMLSFLERQTGVSHVRFLCEPGQGTAAIEGLKDWLARDGKVAWPAARRDVTASKRAVLQAQWLKLVAIGAVTPFMPTRPLGSTFEAYAFRIAGKNGWCFFQPSDYDQVQNALGRKLRHALQQRRATG